MAKKPIYDSKKLSAYIKQNNEQSKKDIASMQYAPQIRQRANMWFRARQLVDEIVLNYTSASRTYNLKKFPITYRGNIHHENVVNVLLEFGIIDYAPLENNEIVSAISGSGDYIILNEDGLKEYQTGLSNIYHLWEQAYEQATGKERRQSNEIDKVLADQIAQAKAIPVGSQYGNEHRVIRDQWLNTKRILQAIHDQVQPLPYKGKPITLIKNQLPKEQQLVFSGILKLLLENQVFNMSPSREKRAVEDNDDKYDSYEDARTTAELESDRKKLVAEKENHLRTKNNLIDNGGTFYLDDVKKFLEARTKIIRAYNEMQADGDLRFPESYSMTSKREFTINTVKNKYPYKMPSGTTWENIIIRFLDDEHVSISVPQQEDYATDFRGMGFKDKRKTPSSKKPHYNQQWALLLIFAKAGGEIVQSNEAKRQIVKATKKNLAQTLQQYFQIEYDPFYPFEEKRNDKKRNSYKIKMTIIPPPEDSSPKVRETTYDDLQEVLSEQTPSVYEDSYEQ